MTIYSPPLPPPAVVYGEPARRSRLAALGSRRWAVSLLLAATTLLYLWGLGASGDANDFYAAAVQAGTKSWKAFLFGSFDSSNFITVDKPPLALWPMELSGRIFGFNSWSMLVPQALEGVAAVWLLYATVRRWFGTGAGLLAGALLALTPVAVLMFRFNNPDAAMTLLLVAAAYLVTRAVAAGSWRWLLGCGAVMGLSFLAKGLQPFTVLPALALVYLIAAPTSLRRRVAHLALAGVAVVVGASWWVLAVQLTPARDRPYIGGSGDNSPLGLAFGYNGVSRLTGGSGAGGPGGGFDGSTGIGRLFNSLNGGQIAWLLPAALLGVVALAVVSARARRTDRIRAAALLWGGWLLVTGVVLSYAGGIIHTYYTVELAPAIAALVAAAAVTLWRRREVFAARVGLAAGAVATGVESWTLLHRSAGWQPWVAWLVLLGSGVAAVAVLLPVARRTLPVIALVAGLVTLTGGSAAYAVSTAATAHTGSTPSAGPALSGAVGFGHGGFPGGRFPGRRFPEAPTSGASSRGAPSSSGRTGGLAGRPGDGAQSVNAAVVSALQATNTRWAAAAVGSQSAAPLELASGKAVMAIGGFSGGDAAPTLAQFEAYVKAGEIKYFVAGGFGGGGPGAAGSAITSWVESHYTAKTIGGMTVYDLTAAP